MVGGFINYQALIKTRPRFAAILIIFAEILISLIITFPLLYITMFVFDILELTTASFGFSGDQGWDLYLLIGFILSQIVIAIGNRLYCRKETKNIPKILLIVFYGILALIAIVLVICLLNIVFDFL